MTKHSLPIKKETEQNMEKIMETLRPNDSMIFMMYGNPDSGAIASAMHLNIQLIDKAIYHRKILAGFLPARLKRKQGKEMHEI